MEEALHPLIQKLVHTLALVLLRFVGRPPHSNIPLDLRLSVMIVLLKHIIAREGEPTARTVTAW